MSSVDSDPPPASRPSPVFVPHFGLSMTRLPPRDAPWRELVSFAGSFDGYSVFPSDGGLQRFVEDGRARFGADGSLPEGMTLLRTALHGEQRANYWSDGDPPTREEMRYIHALVERLRELIMSSAHVAPQQWSPAGIRDKLSNAFERLLVGYASWGGYRSHGWTRETDGENYLGPVIWSERDCGLRFALELEKEWPGATHMEFALGKSTLADYDVSPKRISLGDLN